jgi:formylglycine-generating enzyme required for sulfatase activity
MNLSSVTHAVLMLTVVEAIAANKAGDAHNVDLGGGVKIEMIWIAPGEFDMGSDSGIGVERPMHHVTISQGFWIGKFEVTQEQWEKVSGSNPSKFKGARKPVDNVSWNDCQAFLRKLNASQAGNPQLQFRLPTEAEWEYACRAGTRTLFSFGNDAAEMHKYGNCLERSAPSALHGKDKDHDAGGATTADVGSYRPNAWGLHDMHGNVWEWCWDWYGEYQPERVADPVGPMTGEERVYRGGSWQCIAGAASSAGRLWDPPDYRGDKEGVEGDTFGVRIVRGAVPAGMVLPRTAPVVAPILQGGGTPSLVGKWEGRVPHTDDAFVIMEFGADGTLKVDRGDGNIVSGRYVVDYAASPIRLDLVDLQLVKNGRNEGERKTSVGILEFRGKDEANVFCEVAADGGNRQYPTKFGDDTVAFRRLSAAPSAPDIVGKWQTLPDAPAASSWVMEFRADNTMNLRRGDESTSGKYRVNYAVSPMELDFFNLERHRNNGTIESGSDIAIGIMEFRGPDEVRIYSVKGPAPKDNPSAHPDTFDKGTIVLRRTTSSAAVTASKAAAVTVTPRIPEATPATRASAAIPAGNGPPARPLPAPVATASPADDPRGRGTPPNGEIVVFLYGGKVATGEVERVSGNAEMFGVKSRGRTMFVSRNQIRSWSPVGGWPPMAKGAAAPASPSPWVGEWQIDLTFVRNTGNPGEGVHAWQSGVCTFRQEGNRLTGEWAAGATRGVINGQEAPGGFVGTLRLSWDDHDWQVFSMRFTKGSSVGEGIAIHAPRAGDSERHVYLVNFKRVR